MGKILGKEHGVSRRAGQWPDQRMCRIGNPSHQWIREVALVAPRDDGKAAVLHTHVGQGVGDLDAGAEKAVPLEGVLAVGQHLGIAVVEYETSAAMTGHEAGRVQPKGYANGLFQVGKDGGPVDQFLEGAAAGKDGAGVVRQALVRGRTHLGVDVVLLVFPRQVSGLHLPVAQGLQPVDAVVHGSQNRRGQDLPQHQVPVEIEQVALFRGHDTLQETELSRGLMVADRQRRRQRSLWVML